MPMAPLAVSKRFAGIVEANGALAPPANRETLFCRVFDEANRDTLSFFFAISPRCVFFLCLASQSEYEVAAPTMPEWLSFCLEKGSTGESVVKVEKLTELRIAKVNERRIRVSFCFPLPWKQDKTGQGVAEFDIGTDKRLRPVRLVIPRKGEETLSRGFVVFDKDKRTEATEELSRRKISVEYDSLVSLIDRNETHMVSLLLQAGIPPDLSYWCIRDGKEDELHRLSGLQEHGVTGEEYHNPLLLAIRKKRAGAVRLLLENGSRPPHSGVMLFYDKYLTQEVKALLTEWNEVWARGSLSLPKSLSGSE